MSTGRWCARAAALAALALAAAGLSVLRFPGAAPADEVFLPPPGFELQAAHSGKVLLINGSAQTDGAPVVQFSSNGGLNERWAPVPFGTGFVFVQLNGYKVLDVAGGSTDNGAGLVQQQWNGSASRVWLLVPFGPDASVFINAKSGKAMDVAGASTADSAPVIQWDWQAGANQIWRGIPVGVPETTSTTSTTVAAG
ncbi:MAG TPA: RICIN domain-containing protein [Acidimicrobiales bacterium]|jgi:hypothetical protein|nr:RICIN domain-containing protein [Acidimicrobiales bacterium]